MKKSGYVGSKASLSIKYRLGKKDNKRGRESNREEVWRKVHSERGEREKERDCML
jgi:hypothetical protein